MKQRTFEDFYQIDIKLKGSPKPIARASWKDGFEAGKESMSWRRISEDPPPCDSTFVLFTDGRFMLAHRGCLEYISIDWLPDQTVVSTLQDSGWRYWMPIPPPPTTEGSKQ